MVETLISPGVLARENDSSFVSKRPVQVGAAIIGPAVKGPVEVPTVVTTYNEYVNKFGTTFTSGSSTNQKTYTYFTSIAAYNYFANGGTSLLVSRVVTGSYLPATSSAITNDVPSSTGDPATAIANFNASQTGSAFQGFVIVTPDSNQYWFAGYGGTTFYDTTNPLASFCYFNTGSNWVASASNAILGFPGLSSLLSDADSLGGGDLYLEGLDGDTGLNGTNIYYSDFIGDNTAITPANLAAVMQGATANVTSTTFVLETLSEGVIMNSNSTEIANHVLPSGSKDNIRWQVLNANTSSGTFDLLIRRGNDNNLQPIVLETWTNLNLDPNSPNYISRVLGDMNEYYDSTNNQIAYLGTFTNRSNYVRVSQVNYTTPNYLNSNGAISDPNYTDYIPTNASGTFGGAIGDVKGGANFYSSINNTDTQGLTGGCYNNMISLLANQDDYKFNVLLTPGLYDAGYTQQISTIINNTQDRGDNIYVLDPVAYGAGLSSAVQYASSRNTSYAAEYWPWLQIIEPSTGELVWVPASTMIGGVYAYNDSVAEPWFAPAGINRGGLSTVVRAETKLSQGQRNTLYTGKVNPIATFPGTGVVVYGQKTLQTAASALDRVNVRRLLIALKSYISQVANNLVFEQNTVATRNSFLSQVNPYLTSVQQRQGLYAFKVIMDDTNNTPDVIDRNELIGQIYLQPTKTAEFIYLDFNITPTGASFPA
jgi:phage tail sheath protein FI